ncbi:OmpA family protein [Fulvivirgaceae bacterium BMA10]|uniref:OmpA family protein n=1 Tax=Splendidivirga corallicola TaxID=3051826 RepID=A0ABT8KWU7_9BACT|nr:OmpA family protein [Fulvivirgaceae bacterium BMA10]
MTKRYLTLLLTILIMSPLVAQKKSLKKARKKHDRGEYQVAIAMYERALEKGVNQAESNFQIAEAYRLSNRVQLALPYYKGAIDNGISNENAKLYYAFALKANSQYEEAEKELEQLVANAEDEQVLEKARLELDNLRNLKSIKEKNSYYRVRNLKAINSAEAEYSPIYNNGELYFTSSRGNDKIYKATGTSFTDIYKVPTKGAIVDTTAIEGLSNLVNSPKINDGCVTFSRDGRTMIFAKGNSGRKRGTFDVNLYITRYRRGAWSEPQMLSISDPNAWDSSPAFSRDGRTLYFASNRKGGKGGTDIYSAKLDGRGRWGNVRNMGNVINTTGNEMFPYVADDGKLYFSSDAHPGLGGLDLFVAERKSGKIGIQNLGSPINSSADDFGLFLYSQEKGFFSSNRAGGQGDDDIYTFINNDPNLKIVNYFLEGTVVYQPEDAKEELLDNSRVQLLDSQGELIEEAVTSKTGKFRFRVYEGENYVLVGEKDDYFTTRVDFTTIGKSVPKEQLTQMVTNKTFTTKIPLDQIIIEKSIVLENIFYDFGKHDIRDDAAVELDKLVNILIDNPGISIELSSHTDSVDDEEYNRKLSQRRAEAAVNYIVAAGIDKNRLVAKGYGEAQPIAPNTNPDGSDNPEGRQKNRRTEFKVLKVDKVKEQEDQQQDDLEDDEIDFDENLDDNNDN